MINDFMIKKNKMRKINRNGQFIKFITDVYIVIGYYQNLIKKS